MKKILLFTFIILLALSIGTVSAEENDNNTLTSDVINPSDVISENIQNNDNIILYSGNNGSNSQKTMTELQNTIRNNNTILFLEDDYQCYQQDTDLERWWNLKDGIIVDKSITIDGQGHKIDANHQMRIFQVTNNATVTFKNITFLNGWSDDYNLYASETLYRVDKAGGAVCNNGAKNITIIDCTFNGNTASFGGAINGDCNAINCTFINNTANMFGGAIYINGGISGNLSGTFINNTANMVGGAIYINGGISGNLNGTFINNTAEYGVAIYTGSVSGNLSGTFINNTAFISGVSGNLNGIFINAKYVTKYYGGSEKFVVNITDDKGSPIINKSVKITINGITYNKTTDSKGIASLNIKLSSGTYGVTTCVDNITLKSSVTVLSTVIGKDITKYYKNATQYSVQLYDTNGKAVGAGEFATFNVNGVFYKRVTDKNGIATLNINLPPSNYVITADYKGCEISNNIKVLSVLLANDITMEYMDGTQFKVNLVDGQGKLYKEQFVRFNINGRFYDRLIDNNRVAALNIRLIPGEYIITSSFNGCNIANKITITS